MNYTLLRQADKAVVYQGASLPQTVDGNHFDLTSACLWATGSSSSPWRGQGQASKC